MKARFASEIQAGDLRIRRGGHSSAGIQVALTEAPSTGVKTSCSPSAQKIIAQ
jgi:hypothetical protein